MTQQVFDQWLDMNALRDSGLVWMMNKVIFQPMGYVLVVDLDMESGVVKGWNLEGDGEEVICFDESSERGGFAKWQHFLEKIEGKP